MQFAHMNVVPEQLMAMTLKNDQPGAGMGLLNCILELAVDPKRRQALERGRVAHSTRNGNGGIALRNARDYQRCLRRYRKRAP